MHAGVAEGLRSGAARADFGVGINVTDKIYQNVLIEREGGRGTPRGWRSRVSARRPYVALTAALVVWGLAPNDIVLLLAAFVFAPIGFVAPALQSLMTRRVGPSEQGQLQGANASIAGLTGAIGPIFFGLVYSLAIGYRAQFDLLGLPFLVGAVLMLGSVGVAIRVTHGTSAAPATSVPQPTEGPSASAAPGVEPVGLIEEP